MTTKSEKHTDISLPALGLAALLLLGSCSATEESREEQAESRVHPVEAVMARAGTLPLQERVSGTVRARNQIAVRAEIDAPIVQVYVRSGDEVTQGQPLVRLDDNQLRAQLNQAEAAVRLAQASVEQSQARLAELQAQASRVRRLAEEQLVSALDLETLEAQIQAARANLSQESARVEQAQATAAERRNALARTVIRAPAAGRVGARNAEPGMIASRDTVLFVLGNPSDLIVEVPLTQEMLGNISVGDRALVRTGGTQQTVIEGQLARVSPFLASGSFSTTGEIELEGEPARLSPGMFVAVDLLYGESDPTTLVPASALWEDPASGAQSVYVVADLNGEGARSTLEDPAKRVQRRPVDVLAQGGGMAGVGSVKPGEWVVVAGQHLLAEDRSEVAHVRTASWDRVLNLQSIQREDLQAEYMDKQQRYAAAHGSEPPSNEEYLRTSAAANQSRTVN